MNIEIRPATVRDVRDIHRLVNEYAQGGLLLGRSLNELYEGVRDLLVAVSDGVVIGCCALKVCWEDLAEVQSLAVDRAYHGHGLGRRLVETALRRAAELGIDTVFALTYQTEFFARCGFVIIDRERLPHKVWGQCVHCPKFPDCDESAMVYWAHGEPVANTAEKLGVPPLTPRVAPASEK